MRHNIQHDPPEFFHWFLEWYCNPELLEDIEGDLLEIFEKDIQIKGLNRAKINFALNVLRFVDARTLVRNQNHQTHFAMLFSNYLTTTFRSIKRQFSFSVINLLGLTLGVICSLLLYLYISDELNYDRHHQNADRIHRVVMDVEIGDNLRQVAVSAPAVATTLQKEYPEIENYTLVRKLRRTTFQKDGIKIPQQNIFRASPELFNVFSFELIVGESDEVLSKPRQIVLSETTAKNYFGVANASIIGKEVITATDTLQVSGLMRDVTQNGHFTPNAFISFHDMNHLEVWGDWNWCNYVLFKPNITASSFKPKLDEFCENRMKRMFEAAGGTGSLLLQALPDIHFTSKRDFEMEANTGDMTAIRTFILVAVLILFIAVINYMNLATARSIRRAKEVGVRKVLGSYRGQLIFQFLTESFFFTLIATSLAIVSVYLLLPTFNDLTAKTIEWSSLLSLSNALNIIVLIAALTLLGGGYPAFILSGFNPSKALKGGIKLGKGNLSLRKILVVVQFSISIIMVISTLVIFNQISFINQQDLGFTKEGVVITRLGEEVRNQVHLIRDALVQQPEVIHVGSTFNLPGEAGEVNPFEVETNQGTQSRIFQQIWADSHYLNTLGVDIIAGRNYPQRNVGDTVNTGVLVNEALVKEVGWTVENAVGRKLKSFDWEDEIVGIVKDFHTRSLYESLQPLVIRNVEGAPNILIKLNNNDIAKSKKVLANHIEEITGSSNVSFTFLDNHIEALYLAEDKRGKILALFALAALFIAGLGLFGLAAYLMEQRQKEIGLRKIVGASVPNLLYFMSKDYFKLLIIAIIIAFPITLFGMNTWLEQFAYRIELSPSIFILGASFVFVVCLLIISWNALKASLTKPIETLRDE